MVTRRRFLHSALALSLPNFGIGMARAAAIGAIAEESPEMWLKRHIANLLVDYPIPGISCGLTLMDRLLGFTERIICS